MTAVRMHLDRARGACAAMDAVSTGLSWTAVSVNSALIESARLRNVDVDFGPARSLTEVATFLTDSAADIRSRADVLERGDASLDRGVAQMPERLLQAMLDAELTITPEHAFRLVEQHWDAIGGRDQLADWGDFQALYDTSTDPELRQAIELWQILLFDLVEVADDSDGPRVGANGLDGRIDGRIHMNDLRAFRDDHPDLDRWWADRQERRDRLLPHVLSGDRAVALVLGVWDDIGGRDGRADWDDIERYYQQSGDPQVRAAIDLLRGPLFDLIEVADDGSTPGLDVRGLDVRRDGRIHRNDFNAFIDSLGGRSIQEIMDERRIEPPVLRLPDPFAHIDQTSIVVFSGALEAAAKGEAELGYRVHQIADGTVVVERIAGLGVGVEGGIGVKAELRWGRNTYGGAAIAEAGALVTLRAEQTWVLADGEEARTLIVRQVVDTFPAGAVVTAATDFAADRIDDVTPEFVEDASGWVITHIPLIGDDIMAANDQAQRYLRYESPTPYRSTIALGEDLAAEAAARTDGLGAWIEGDITGSVSASSYADGTSSTTYAIGGQVGGGLVLGGGALLPGTPPLGPTRRRLLDEQHGAGVQLEIEERFAASGSRDEVVATITAQVDDSLTVTTITYDAAVAEADAAADTIVRGLQRLSTQSPLTSVGSLLEAPDIYRALADAPEIEGTTMTTRNWAVGSSNYGFTLEGEALVKVGVDANVEVTSLTPVDD